MGPDLVGSTCSQQFDELSLLAGFKMASRTRIFAWLPRFFCCGDSSVAAREHCLPYLVAVHDLKLLYVHANTKSILLTFIVLTHQHNAHRRAAV